MRRLIVRLSALAASFLWCLWSVVPGADDPPQTPIEVNEWSIWVANPAQTTINTGRVYKSAMPGAVGTSRPKFEDNDKIREQAARFPIAPISVVQFFGESCKDVDINVRTKKGLFLAHWPPSTERSGRLQWFGSSLSQTPPANIPQGYFSESHWFQKLRDEKSALYIKHESRLERFVAYDAELSISVPLKLRGGPDEYTLQNLTNRRLVDIAVIAPVEGGFRVGWLDELPTAAPEKEKEEIARKKEEETKPKKSTEPKKTPATKEEAEAVFNEAEKAKEKDKTKDEEPPPLPPEGDANIRARVDQVLNRPVIVAVDQAPRREVLGLIMAQVRLGYDIDDKTLTKADINLDQPTDMKANNLAARDALAEVLGAVGLSYRITEEGKLFITTAARLADETSKKNQVIEGPPVKLPMSQPVKPSQPTYRELTRDTLARRLSAQGLRGSVVEFVLEQYGSALFEPGELIVLAHLSREALDETVLLDVFPPPKKLARSALLVIHGVDPRLQDRARALVQQLGDPSSRTRDTAEGRLFELGPVAVPALEDALSSKDIEVVFRAERLLLKFNRQVP